MGKRRLAVLLALVLAVSTAACGKSKDKESAKKEENEEIVEEKETYRFKIWVSEQDISEEDGSWIKTRCDMFAAKYQDDEVIFEYEAYPEEEAEKKMDEDRKAAPDIFIFKSSQTDKLVEDRLLTRLWGDTEEYVLSSNTTSISGLATYQGKVYGIPIAANPYILYYDKRVFSEEDVRDMDTILEKGVLAYPLGDERYTKAFYEAQDVVEVPEEETDGWQEEFPEGEEQMFGETQAAGEEPAQTDAPESEEGALEFEDESWGEEDEDEDEETMLSAEEVDEWLAGFRARANVINDIDGTTGLEGLKDGTVQAVVYDYASYQEVKEILGENMGVAALPVIHINGEDKQLKCVEETQNIGVNPDCENFEMTIALATYLGSADSQQMRYDMSGVVPVNLTAVQTLPDLDLTKVIAQIADKENPGWDAPEEEEEEK